LGAAKKLSFNAEQHHPPVGSIVDPALPVGIMSFPSTSAVQFLATLILIAVVGTGAVGKGLTFPSWPTALTDPIAPTFAFGNATTLSPTMQTA